VARGIEDMQVEYMNGSGAWAGNAGPVTCSGTCTSPTLADWNSIVRQVKVTLSARAVEPRLQGETTSAQGAAVRGQLSAVIAPRAAQLTLQRSNVGLWR
jgi:hypothetical protein